MTGLAMGAEKLPARRSKRSRRARSAAGQPFRDRPRFAVSGVGMSTCTGG